MAEFVKFPKMGRLFRDIVVTEKLDGTNAAVVIDEDGCVFAQSRNRLITPDDDNFGFARWVSENEDDLRALGRGHHFGEWWGQGIQRGYGLTEKRFSLFNALRWGDYGDEQPPACCHVVPLMYKGIFDADMIKDSLSLLEEEGSKAVQGYMNPEGIIIFHTHSNVGFKYTIGDDGHKGEKR